MKSLDRAKLTAEGYYEEIVSTARIRMVYNDLIVGQSAKLFGAFDGDKFTKSKLQEALKYKQTDAGGLYKALIVQANGVFEQYIKDFTAAITNEIVKNSDKYSNLHEDFKKNYIASSARVLGFIKKDTINGQTYDFDGLLKSLGKCFSDFQPYKINSEVFTMLMGNCTADRLENIFEILGMDKPFSHKIGDNPKLKTALKETRRTRVADMARTELNRQIDVRNRIVHGSLSTSVSLSDLNESVEFFKALIKAFDNAGKTAVAAYEHLVSY